MGWLLNLSADDIQNSKGRTFVIFKHSPRCSISLMAKSRWERNWRNEQIPVYLVDVINQRLLSNAIAHHFKVEHQSPQVLLIQDGVCTFNDSHNSINPNDILELIPN